MSAVEAEQIVDSWDSWLPVTQLQADTEISALQIKCPQCPAAVCL